MSNPMVQADNSQANPLGASAAPSASDATTAGASASMNINANSKISSLADFKKKAPKVYNMMMQSMMQACQQDMQRHADNLKKAMRGDGS